MTDANQRLDEYQSTSTTQSGLTRGISKMCATVVLFLFATWHLTGWPDARERLAIERAKHTTCVQTEGIYKTTFGRLGFAQPKFLPVRIRHISVADIPAEMALLRDILGSSSGLQSLTVLGHLCQDQDLTGLHSCPTLFSLTVTGAPDFTGSSLGTLPNGCALRLVDLSDTGFQDDGARALVQLQHLEELNLLNTHVTDTGLSYLAKIPHLKLLLLSSPYITNAGLSAFSQSRNLEDLEIQPHSDALSPDAVNQEGIDRLNASMPWCRF